GFIPIVDTFAQFGVTKGNLPLTMAALSQSPVIAVFSHAGFQDAADGASHQATTYIAALSAIPHTTVIVCSCADQARALMHQAIRRHAEARKKGEDGETVAFIVGRENFPVHYTENTSYEWGKPQVLKKGKDVVIVAAGPMVGKALDAAKLLEQQNVSATVLDNPFVNQPDVETIGAAVQTAGGRLITIEDHQLISGMGSVLIHALTQKGVALRARSLGIRGQFGQSAYVANQLYDLHRLNAEAIVKAVKEICAL
ncbi:MAG: transketolase C-terminal domain-containing protein, partial [bacterium]